MTPEEKNLLIMDLCCRIPYGVQFKKTVYGESTLCPEHITAFRKGNMIIIPYLRPMKSMTTEEYESIKKEFLFFGGSICSTSDMITSGEVVDWLNKHHFDYRGLIEKGLALEAPEDLYSNESEYDENGWKDLGDGLKMDKDGNIAGGLKLK